jgi:hypothetical protein
MIVAKVFDRAPNASPNPNAVLIWKGPNKMLVQCRDKALARSLKTFFAFPSVEWRRGLDSMLSAMAAEEGSAEHFVSRCDRLHSLGLRAVLKEV